MNTRIFLDNFWSTELRDDIFVAMPFDEKFDERWEKIFKPAIEGVQFQGRTLNANRVDIRKSGDSILTDINDGIAHSQLILADISVTREWKATSGDDCWHRNENVMYEVGIAVACRQPVEVVLIRDDRKPLLFDVTATPVKPFNPSDLVGSAKEIRDLLQDRIDERKSYQKLQLHKVFSSLSKFDVTLLHAVADRYPGVFEFKQENLFIQSAMPRLLDKGIFAVEVFNKPDSKRVPGYRWTNFGRLIFAAVQASFPDVELNTDDK